MKISIIFQLFLLTIIKSETWYDPVSGANRYDGKNGYAGSRGKALTHFYLCGNRLYRVHYLGADKDTWTGEYCCCGEVGDGRPIDGIAISGGQGYQVRLKNGKWQDIVYGYDIYDHKNGMAGIFNYPIDAILVSGGDTYRAAIGPSTSLIEIVATKLSNNLFQVHKEFNFESEEFILDNDKVLITGKLYHNLDAQLSDGIIKLTIQDNNVVHADWSGLLPENVNKALKSLIDVYNQQTTFESKITAGIVHGDVSVKIFWAEKKIEINASSKITKDHWSHRGGVKFTIYMKDNHNSYKKYAKNYATICNFNWEKAFGLLKDHVNHNHVGYGVMSGIISTCVFVALSAARIIPLLAI